MTHQSTSGPCGGFSLLFNPWWEVTRVFSRGVTALSFLLKGSLWLLCVDQPVQGTGQCGSPDARSLGRGLGGDLEGKQLGSGPCVATGLLRTDLAHSVILTWQGQDLPVQWIVEGTSEKRGIQGGDA